MMLVQNLRLALKGQFAKNVATVATGTAIAQVISILIVPIITRLYGPEAFGFQSLFISVSTLISTVAALSYPLAIVLPRKDSDAVVISLLSLVLAAITALVSFFVLLSIDAFVVRKIGVERANFFIFLLPLSIFATVMVAVASQLLVRNQQFREFSIVGVVQAVSGNGIKALVGLYSTSAVLLVAIHTAATCCTSVVAYRLLDLSKSGVGIVSRGAIVSIAKKVAREYRDFALWRAPQNFLSMLSQSAPVIFLTAYFGTESAGYYAAAIMLLSVPTNLLGNAIASVFYPKVTEKIHQGDRATALIVKTTAAMAVIGCVPFLLVISLGPALFEVVLGQGWAMSGVYAQWLAAWIFFQYINKPAVAAIPALNLQAGLLLYEVLTGAVKVLALWVGYEFYSSDLASIILFSACGAVSYISLIVWVLIKSTSNIRMRGN